jgi:hypothetical protein
MNSWWPKADGRLWALGKLEQTFAPEFYTKDALEKFGLAIWTAILADRVETRFAGD